MAPAPSALALSEGTKTPRWRGRLRLILVALTAILAAWLGACFISPAARGNVTLNLPGRDASIVLRDLGKGRASFYNLTTDGAKAASRRLWTGKLPVKSTRFIAGDLTKDGFTDVAALVKVRTSARLLVFTSSGTRLKLTAQWKGKLNWAQAQLSVGFFVPGQTRDLALTVRDPDGGGSLMLFRLAGKRLAAPQVMPLPAGIPAAAVMTTGDVNGDFHDELVFLGAGAADGDSRLLSYVNNNGTWEVEKTWDGTLPAKGAQLSCGDVDGDGIAEPVALTGATATITIFDCDGDTVAASSKPGASVGIPSPKCRLGVADMTGDARADLVTLQPKGTTRSTLRVAISNASGFSPATFWSGKGACARCRFSCAASMPVRVHDDVHTLSVETVAAIVSTTTNSQTVTFSGAPADVVSLEQGDVVLAEPAALIPDGVMRKVDSVETANGQTVLTTTPATLEDVYLQAEIDVRAPMEAQPMTARRVAGRLNQCQGGPGRFTLASITIPIDEEWSDVDDAGKISATLKGEFKASLNLICWIKIKVDWWYVVPTDISIKAGMGLGFDQRFDCTLTVNYKKNFKWQKDLLKQYFTGIYFSIGPIPCWIQPYAIVQWKANLAVNAKAVLKVNEHVWAKVGAEYDDGWKNISGGDIDVPTPDFKLSGTLDAKAAVIIKGGGLLYGIFGPNVGFGPYLRAHAGLKDNVPENPWWRLFGGIEASVGVRLEVPILDEFADFFTWEYDWGPWTLWEKEIAHAPIDTTKPVDPAFFTSVINGDENWQKGPVRLEFAVLCSGSPYDRTTYSLDGAAWKTMPLASPRYPVLTVSGEGSHPLQYRSYAKNGYAEDVHDMTVNIDMTTPTITCSGVDPIGAAQWRGEPATVSLHAADAGGSGVFYTNLYVGGVPTRYVMTPDVTRTIAVDGRSIISWQVYDRACNKSTMAMGELKIDLLPPITMVSGADDAWHSGPVTLTFSATDVHGKVAGSGVDYTEYRVGQSGTFGDWTRGTSVTVNGNGDHEVQYRSADKVGHVEDPKSVHVKIDSTGGDSVAPTTTVSSYDTGWNITPVTLNFTAIDPEPSSGLDYTESKVDDGDWVKGTSLTISNDGDHAVRYRSADARGNLEASNSCQVKVDQTPPTCTVDGADQLWHAQPVTLTFTGRDRSPGSGLDHVEYRIDGGDWVAGTSVTIPTPPAPEHLTHDYAVDYRAIDIAGNTGASQTVHVKIDTDNQAPTCTITGTDGRGNAWVGGDWYNTPVNLTFSATDPGSGSLPAEYSTDGGATWAWVSSLPSSTLTIAAPTDGSNDGEHTVWCRATDPTGQSDQVSGTVRIDMTPPVTDVTGTDGNGNAWVPGDWNWYRTPVSLKLKPGDPPGKAGVETSGVDHYDYLFSPPSAWVSSAAAGATVTDIELVANLAGDRTDAWAATGASSLRRSTDGGSSWNQMPTGTEESFSYTEFAGRTTAWAAGSRVARSTDGGSTWSLCSAARAGGTVTAATATALVASPIDGRSAWIIGNYAWIPSSPPRDRAVAAAAGVYRVFSTTDGGAAWTMQTGPGGYLTDIVCADDGRSLWAVNDTGGIWHTSDGGVTWASQSPPPGFDITTGFTHAACLNAQVAWAFTSDGRAIRTANGGATWRVWDSAPATGLYDVLSCESTGTALLGLGGDGSPVVRSYDSGTTWGTDWADTAASLGKGRYGGSGTVHAGIACASDVGAGTGYAWDASGRLFSYHDTNKDQWQHVGTGATTDIVVDANGQNLVHSEAVDAAGNVEKIHSSTIVFLDRVAPYTATYGAVAHDNPGGSGLPKTALLPFPNPGTWFEYPTPDWRMQDKADNGGTSSPITAVSFSDERHGIAGWEKTDTSPGALGVQVTTDGGLRWQQSTFHASNIGRRLTGAACASSGSTVRAYATGAYAYQPYKVRTDYHCVWSLQPDGWRKTVLQQDDSAAGSLVPAVLGVGCPANDTNLAWAVGTGGRIWRTTNGGVSWGNPMTPTTTPLTAVCAYKATPTSAVQAWAVGWNGAIYRTPDGGWSWLYVTSPTTSTLSSVSCARSSNGDLNVWAVGVASDRDSVIVHSTDGGQHWSSQVAYTNYAHLVSVSCGMDSVFFSADDGKVWRKTWDKATGWQTGWTDITKSGGFGTTGLKLAAVSDSTVYAAGSGGDVWTTSHASPSWWSALPPYSWDSQLPGATYSYFSQDLAGNKEPEQTWTAP